MNQAIQKALSAIGEVKEFLGEYWLFSTIALLIIVAVIILIKRFLKIAANKSRLLADDNHIISDQVNGLNFDDENNDLIFHRIARLNGKYKSILFAGDGLKSLPITVAVNICIKLAAIQKKILLIDTDLQRNAAARVFDIPASKTNKIKPQAIQTEFENLWLWPADNFTNINQMNIRDVLAEQKRRFDMIIINSPCLAGSCDKTMIIGASDGCFAFLRKTSASQRLLEDIKKSPCRLIANIEPNG